MIESFEDLAIKSSYDSEEDNILSEFYIPVLKTSKKYWRIAGYFTSTSLAVAARGMAQFIRNGGKMRLVTGARLNPSDVQAIVDGKMDVEKLIGQKFLEELGNLEEKIHRDAIGALAWMVSSGKLDLKVGIVEGEDGLPIEFDKINDDYIFHSKVGICFDDYGNALSFSGSINETRNAWLHNIENFKVFKGWKEEEEKFLEDDVNMFNKYWMGETTRARMINLPNEVYQDFIKRAPPNIEEFLPSLNKPIFQEKTILKEKKAKFGIGNLRPYQKEALDNFFENSGRGFLEMATGTGKTFTALGILKKLMDEEEKLCTVITCPLQHLMDNPWISSLDEFGIKAVKISGEVRRWREKLAKKVFQLNRGHIKQLVIITTHESASITDFVNLIEDIKIKTMILADEVHGMGSESRLEGLSSKYDYRLGLSATPKRWMDEEGTAELEHYFGKTIYDFTLNRAIKEEFLCEYKYIPHFVTLNSEELINYRELSISAASAFAKRNDVQQYKIYQSLLNKRAQIVKAAEAKLETLSGILENMKHKSHCLIYTTYSQREDVLAVARKHLDLYHQFTYRENREERKRILDEFDCGDLKALIAENCLDEGVDVPATKTAIIMSSSGNPRQYIQRRGRVLRKHKSKDYAVIHDLLVIPDARPEDKSFQMERALVEKETKRYLEFARSSLNAGETLKAIHDIRLQYNL